MGVKIICLNIIKKSDLFFSHMGDQNIKRLIRQFWRVWLQEDQIVREFVEALDIQMLSNKQHKLKKMT